MIMSELKNSRKNLRSILDQSAKSKTAKKFLQLFDELQNGIKQKRDAGFTDLKYLQSLADQGRSAIQQTLIEFSLKEREKLSIQLSELKKRYDAEYLKDFSLHDFEIRNSERKYHAMSEKELIKYTYDVVGQKEIINDPNVANCLINVLAERKVMFSEGDETRILADHLRHELIKMNYDRPHLRTEEGKLLYKMYAAEKYYGDGVPFEIDGKFVQINYEDLLSTVTNEEEVE